MSARFFKIFSIVLAVHLIVLKLVWVGFQAPGPRPPATFIYEGSLPAQGSDSGDEDVWQKNRMSDQFTLDHRESPYTDHWTSLRAPDFR